MVNAAVHDRSAAADTIRDIFDVGGGKNAARQIEARDLDADTGALRNRLAIAKISIAYSRSNSCGVVWC